LFSGHNLCNSKNSNISLKSQKKGFHMKLLKNILPIIALLAITGVDAVSRTAKKTTNVSAGRTGTAAKKTAASTTAKRTTAARKPATTATAAAAGTFTALRNNVMKMNKAQVIDTASGQFTADFITDVVSMVEESELGEMVLRTLLQTARDQFVVFTGNDDKDLALLRSINQQISDAASTVR
jgi:hypothetical protein